MTEIPLHHVWSYTDVDLRFWAEHLADWLPQRLIDAHTHVTNPAARLRPMTEARRRQYWVSEVNEPIPADQAKHCYDTVLPGRQLTAVAMGSPDLDYDLEAVNEYVRTETQRLGWHALALLRPQWSAQRVEQELAKPGVIGLKPYYSLIGASAETRDKHIEASIFEFLPEAVLEVANARRAWITLHVPRADRLGHPDNIREVQAIRRRWPDIVLVIAHFGRSYTEPHAREGLAPLIEDAGLVFDNSAVLNPAVHRLALEWLGPRRVLWGTDNPIFYMRGRRQWQGRTYINRTSHPFHFNTNREAPEIEANYTLMMYEALKALKDACTDLGLTRSDIEAIFHDNAARLIATASA